MILEIMVDLPKIYKGHSGDFICENTNPSQNYFRHWVNVLVLFGISYIIKA